MTTRGAKITLRLKNKKVLNGWLYADTGFGLYVSMDKTVENIRFFPRDSFESISYEYSDIANFAPVFPFDNTVDKPQTSASFESQVDDALNKIDYNRIRRINSEFDILENQFSQGQYRTLKEGVSLFSVSIRTKTLYSDLIDEIEKSGLDKVLLNNSKQIRELVSLGKLPLIDLLMRSTPERRFWLESMIYSTINQDLLTESRLGKTYLAELTEEKIARTVIDSADNKNEDIEPVLKHKKDKKVAKRLRKISSVGKIIIGGGLASANVAVGAFVGILTALPTLGIGTVSGAVGIVTSVYAGLNAACDGLKDFATTIES